MAYYSGDNGVFKTHFYIEDSLLGKVTACYRVLPKKRDRYITKDPAKVTCYTCKTSWLVKRAKKDKEKMSEEKKIYVGEVWRLDCFNNDSGFTIIGIDGDVVWYRSVISGERGSINISSFLKHNIKIKDKDGNDVAPKVEKVKVYPVEWEGRNAYVSNLIDLDLKHRTNVNELFNSIGHLKDREGRSLVGFVFCDNINEPHSFVEPLAVMMKRADGKRLELKDVVEFQDFLYATGAVFKMLEEK